MHPYAMVAPDKLVGAIEAFSQGWTEARGNVERDRIRNRSDEESRGKTAWQANAVVKNVRNTGTD